MPSLSICDNVFVCNGLPRDKTSDLQNQTLAVVTFQHVPASYKITARHVTGQYGESTSGFSGLEVQVTAPRPALAL